MANAFTYDDGTFREHEVKVSMFDIQLVYACGIKRTPEATLEAIHTQPEAKPATTLTMAAVVPMPPTGEYATPIKTVCILSVEALAQLYATIEVDMEHWTAAERSRFNGIYDQAKQSARRGHGQLAE